MVRRPPTAEVPANHGDGTFWRRLTGAERAAFAEVATGRTHQKGTTLINAGATDRWAAVIWSGRVRVLGARSAQVIAIRGGGDIIGEQTLIDGGLQPVTVVAETSVRLLLFDGATLKALVTSFPRIQQVLAVILSERLREYDDRLAGRTGDAFLRIVRHLLEHMDGRARSGSLAHTVHIGSQATLGVRLGVSRDSVIRAFSRLRKERVVTTGRGWVVVRDPRKLRNHLTG